MKLIRISIFQKWSRSAFEINQRWRCATFSTGIFSPCSLPRAVLFILRWIPIYTNWNECTRLRSRSLVSQQRCKPVWWEIVRNRLLLEAAGATAYLGFWTLKWPQLSIIIVFLIRNLVPVFLLSIFDRFSMEKLVCIKILVVEVFPKWNLKSKIEKREMKLLQPHKVLSKAINLCVYLVRPKWLNFGVSISKESECVWSWNLVFIKCAHASWNVTNLIGKLVLS